MPAEPITDAVVADYMVQLKGAGQDCRSALEWVKDWFDGIEG
ncbi:MAG: hypothetical protein ABJ195_13740 [Marinomonas sp.]